MKSEIFDERKYIYLLKFFAIFSVVCAHSATLPSNFSNSNQIVGRILSCIGVLGVPIFFIVSGYLFCKNKKPFGEFLKGKIPTIIIPWVFCETIVWLYEVLRKGGISLASWGSFLIGIDHSTYYLTILVLFFILYFNFYKSNIFLFSTIVISVMSIVMTSFDLDEYNTATITPYLNPLNWMLYFSLGILVYKYKLLERIAIFARKIIVISSAALVLDVFLHIKFDLTFSYWSSFAIVNILISLFVIFGLASILLDRKAFLLVSIGRLSFSIYLLHELIVGLIIYLSSKYDIWVGTLARPFIVILLVTTGIYIYTYCATKLKCEKTALMLIGTKPQMQQRKSEVCY